MRYWVYINDKVEGPYEEAKLVTLQGFTPDTLICSEEVASGGGQEWVKASNIFEFDQVEKTVNQPAPAAYGVAAQEAPTAQPAEQPAAQPATGDTNLLLEKIDQLTREVSGLQSTLNTMQTKLDEAITAAQNARAAEQAASGTPAYIPPQENDDAKNTITLTRHDIEPALDDEAITNTESLVSRAEDIVAAASQPAEKPLEMLGEVDLGNKQDDTNEVALGSKVEEAVVLRSALDSLYNAKVQTQEEKESTFQDLLTPSQAHALDEQAQAKEHKEETPAPAAEGTAKDALLNELTAEPQKEDVLDQLIKEKETEKKDNTFKMAAAAAVGAVAGLAAAEGLKEEKEPAPGLETVQDAAAEPVEEKKTLDFSDESKSPALSIAADVNEPEKHEEVLPAEQMPADVPAVTETPQAEPAPAAEHLPSLEGAGKEPVQEAEKEKEATLQELVPGAKTEKPDGVLITEQDLKEAFTERSSQDDQSVEQLFGVPAAQQPAPAAEPAQAASLPQFSDQTADKPLPVGNPNDLTEIELKEGSTYLISDFVPPAQADANALPKELEKANTKAEKEKAENKEETGVQEMVSPLKQTETPVAPAQDAPSDVTVSQVILENTIKTKRGATLDIKTVPMVPEPAQSERLNLDGMEDDINTQHDLKAADVKPQSKAVKATVGVLVALVLAAAIYAMLGLMNLLPASVNVFANKQQAEAQQAEDFNAQMDEILGSQPAQTPEAAPAPAADPTQAVLADVQNYPLANGYTLKQYIEARHPASVDLITWDISTAVDPDNYSVLVKVPPENPQSFKISYRFNYNAVTKALDPTISDAKNLLDSVVPTAAPQQQQQALQ